MSTPVAKPESALQDLARLESVGASLRAMDVRVILKIIEHHFTHHAVLARASCVLGGLVWASIDNPVRARVCVCEHVLFSLCLVVWAILSVF